MGRAAPHGSPARDSPHQAAGHGPARFLDDTGLLFYNARYYDSAIGRFLSADTVVPGSPSGSMDGVAVKSLTVSFHEAAFRGKLAQENSLGFWFQLGDDQRRQHGSPMGPAQPQALNRYSYVLNNPMRWTDPGGHQSEADEWTEWATKMHQVIDAWWRIIHSGLTALKDFLIAAIDAGTEVTVDFIMWVLEKLGLDPAVGDLVRTALDIFVGEILGGIDKALVWAIYGTAETLLGIKAKQQHDRVTATALIHIFGHGREDDPLPGRDFFEGGCAWDEAYQKVYGGAACVPVHVKAGGSPEFPGVITTSSGTPSSTL